MQGSRAFVTIVTLFLTGILFFSVLDIIQDSLEGVTFGHFMIETSQSVLVFGAILWLLRRYVLERRSSSRLASRLRVLSTDRDEWRQKAERYVKGLSEVIEQQFKEWHLTEAEIEVGFMVLKGFALKEIADMRSTREKTVYAQTQTIYRKSNLSGRTEFSAFFLEDLLPASITV